ncbi:MAG: hypothetical protein JSV05_02000 [Candidatus Bathyarchaeota archaeon]|nr:MAG: hypothetical protein JSV05_02000 [Candidatus Bathyarchaeota archaeon]
MNVPLRALSWALYFFWIITLAFAATCVYSAMLMNVSFGEPIISWADEVDVMLPISFDNGGYYNIADLNVTTLITDYLNSPIEETTTFVAQILPQNNATVFHFVSFNISEITDRSDYLFNDSNFTLHGSVYMNYADLVPFGFERNLSIPWGAPLFNFTVGMFQSSIYNLTHLRINLPISFQNHSPYFNVTGTIDIEIFNDQLQPMGAGWGSIDTPSNSNYTGAFAVLVNSTMMTERIQIHIHFDTELFDYGPMVIEFG